MAIQRVPSEICQTVALCEIRPLEEFEEIEWLVAVEFELQSIDLF